VVFKITEDDGTPVAPVLHDGVGPSNLNMLMAAADDRLRDQLVQQRRRATDGTWRLSSRSRRRFRPTLPGPGSIEARRDVNFVPAAGRESRSREP
jgi:hypothetical protein